MYYYLSILFSVNCAAMGTNGKDTFPTWCKNLVAPQKMCDDNFSGTGVPNKWYACPEACGVCTGENVINQ